MNNVKKRTRSLACHVLFFLFIALALPTSVFGAPQYVFLFIGDGMGIAQRNAAELFLAGQTRSKTTPLGNNSSHLIMNSFPIQTTMATHSLSGTTDSAAAATAIATGNKTKNGRIAMDSTGNTTWTPLTKKARAAGMKVGVVTSSFLQDATPAAFFANAKDRRDHYNIGLQLISSHFDYFGGGGFRSPKGKKQDKADLYTLAQKEGYSIFRPDAKNTLSYPKNRRILACAPRNKTSALPYEIDREIDEPPLSAFVRLGINVLDNPKGFFFVVEGGKIDLACHANDLGTTIHEVIAFDEAVAEALLFYKQHPEQTLIIVVGDHETGGLSLAPQIVNEYTLFSSLLARQKNSHLVAEGKAKQLKGPASSLFFGLSKQSGDPLALLESDYAKIKDAWMLRNQTGQSRFATYHPLTVTSLRIRDSKLGVSWKTFYHTNSSVALSVLGKGEGKFKKKIDNTALFHILEELLAL